ncbi:MAG: TonB-dependent receptor [Bacteroidota bacterium]|nr:TonB-dependent receptor [Bacteroidota bacterium]
MLLLFFISFPAWSQKVTLSGYIRDAASGEELIGAAVNTNLKGYATVTNSFGFYSLTLPAGPVELRISYLGYETITRKVDLKASVTMNFTLKEEAQELNEVIVSDSKLDENLQTVEMSVAKLSAKEIQKIPQLLGETDIIRTLTLLPGITTVGEGANGFNVRGGNADQNLLLLDDAPVFNSSHLFGFFSVFNADAVKDVKVYKGGIPAKYGGRLSSVLDIRQKDGNNKEFHGTGGLGLLSSRLLIEGPIVKEKVSFLIGGRRSYQDLFFGLSNDPQIQESILYFYDLNGKINYRISDRDRLYLSGYFGKDVFGIQDRFGFGWGNITTTLRWNHLFSDRLFSNFSVVYSDYNYNLGTLGDNDGGDFRLEARIRNNILNGSFTHYVNTRNTLEYGFNSTYYIFEPGNITGDITLDQPFEYALETGFYISNEQDVTDQLKLQYGLRYSTFFNLGPRAVNTYEEGKPISDETVVSTTEYASGEVVSTYAGWEGLEPRFAANYRVDEKNSVKASYNRTRQYIHLISNTTTPTPVDLWRPSGPFIKPATVDQVAVGYFRNFRENAFNFSVETYYKWFQNLVDYKDNAQLFFKENLETELLTGQGRAYGLEVLLEKKTGSLTGWLSYTLSRSERLVSGPTRETTINNGEWYPSNFDKTHDVSLVLNYALSSAWDVGMTFVYQTGRPITYPSARGEFEGNPYPIYDNRNGARIPDYHRMDLSATYTPKANEERWWKSSLSFGFYNVYARKNAYSIYFQQVRDQPEITQAIRLSIFATIIPYFTYNFSF